MQCAILNNALEIFKNRTDKWSLEKYYKIVSHSIPFEDYEFVSQKRNQTRSLL